MPVMPAQAGIHDFHRQTAAWKVVDARLRGHNVRVFVSAGDESHWRYSPGAGTAMGEGPQ